MRPPCELVIKYVLPAFRSLIARELIERHGYPQTIVAKKLGTTQATISNYSKSKRGMDRMRHLRNIPAVKRAVDDIVEGIVKDNMNSIEAMNRFCKLCIDLRTQDLICEIHKDFLKLPEPCNLCLQR